MRIESDDCCFRYQCGSGGCAKRESATLFSHFLAEADLVIAPNILIAEATNVCWKYQKLSNYTYDECEKSIDHIVSLPDENVNEQDLYLQ